MVTRRRLGGAPPAVPNQDLAVSPPTVIPIEARASQAQSLPPLSELVGELPPWRPGCARVLRDFVGTRDRTSNAELFDM